MNGAIERDIRSESTLPVIQEFIEQFDVEQ